MSTERARRALATLGVVVASLLGAGCSSSSSSSSPATGDGGATPPALPAPLAVTADWLHHTVSLVDFDALVVSANDGGTARAGTLDLSKYPQGPYNVRITPDGKTALVTLSAGFFSISGAGFLVNAASVPTGPSNLVFVDLASRKVTAELDTGDGPTGIAITRDGRLAFVCHVGTSMLSVVDVAAHTVRKQVDLGGAYAEEVMLDDSDTVGIVTYLDPATNSKNARTFAVADMATTLSAPIPLGSDAAGVPFFPGTKKAFVVLAYNPLTSPASGYALIDASDPGAPVKLAGAQWSDATYIAYPGIGVPGRGTVLVPLATGSKLSVREYALAGSDVTLQKTYDVAPVTQLFGAFGAVVDSMDRVVLTLPGERQLAVLDLGSGASFTVPWFSEAGPMGIALH